MTNERYKAWKVWRDKRLAQYDEAHKPEPAKKKPGKDAIVPDPVNPDPDPVIPPVQKTDSEE